MRGVLRVLLTLALGAVSAGYFLAEKRVTLADEGRVSTVKTFAPTVGDALVRLDVEVGPDDRVLPRASSELGGKIEVRRGKQVLVVLNGERRAELVTGGTVGEILSGLAIDPGGAYLHPSLTTSVKEGDEIVVAQPGEVTVEYDGVATPIVTNALTAGALLRQLGIVIGPHDRVEPSIVAQPVAGSVIKVIRVSEAIEKTHSPIPFKRVTQKTDDLELGLKKIQNQGVDGVLARSYRVTYEDGKVKSRTFIGKEVVRQPRDEITLIGTKRPVLKAPNHLQTGKASWYSYPGLSAAHRTLPMGTVVRVTNLANGKQVTVTIRDRGPYVEGRIIDLSDSAFREIAPQGAGVVTVNIEW